MHKSWNQESSCQLYNIKRWSDGLFGINEKGHLVARPDKDPNGNAIDLIDIIEEAKKKGLGYPLVIRFHDILRQRVIELNETFRQTIKEADFQGQYLGVFPIKVNQMREVVEEVLDAGDPYNYGLEAGSRPELMAALAYNTNPQALTILNGFKDRSYLQLAMLGRKLDRKIIVVIEKLSELPHVLDVAKEMNVTPLIGLRCKLASKGTGKWSESSGSRAKFGLSIPEIINAIEILKSRNAVESLCLLHMHIGSQITDIRSLKNALTEAARVYAKLIKMGLNIKYFDVGGGIGVDYDGTRSESESSMNYHLKDYIEDVVYILKEICQLEDVPHPNIVTETGRAVAAHHSCVVTQVFGRVGHNLPSRPIDVLPSEHNLVRNMYDLYKDLDASNVQEVYHDTMQIYDDMINAFKLGIINLQERSKIEIIQQKIYEKIVSYSSEKAFTPEDILSLPGQMSDQYICNFSIFQSAPDTWAIGQILPIVPLTRLDESPQNLCTLADITCDSDGKINKFCGPNGQRQELPIHNLNEGEEYPIGLFLTGAYQDIIGDMHNLFGRPNEVHVYLDSEDPNHFFIEEVVRGNTSFEVLETLQYNPCELSKMMKKSIEEVRRSGKLRPRESVQLTKFYEECLEKTTYLEH